MKNDTDRKAKTMTTKILSTLVGILCPEDPATMIELLSFSINEMEGGCRLPIHRDLATLALSPVRDVSIISRSILASYTTRLQMSQHLKEAASSISGIYETENSSLSSSNALNMRTSRHQMQIRCKTTIGKQGFARYRSMLQSLLLGNPLPTYKYKCRNFCSRYRERY